MSEKVFSRSQFLDQECSLDEYYRSIYRELGITMVNDKALPKMRNAIESGDEDLNTIPLSWWDAQGAWLLHSPRAHAVFKSRNDSLSLAGIVCLLKTAARDAVNGTGQP